VSYQYDADGLLTTAGALQIQRDAATGFVNGSALGGTSESRTYDAYGAEASYTASFGGGNLYSVTYTRDALGRIASKTERVGAEVVHTFSYSYDVAGRLTDALKDGTPTAHYAYDANGNRLTGPGLTATPAYDAQDRLLSYGACTYGYKTDGSLQTKTCPDGTTSYDYDALGNLRGVTLSNGKRISYVIDGQNRRVGRKVNNVLVEGFLYRNQLRPAAWLNGDGSIRATFVYGLHANVPEYMVQGGVNYRLVTDQVGSVRLVVNTSTGTAVERIDYDEFGNVVGDSAPGFQPFGFAGGLRDMDTALVRFGARDYDPVIGRWTAKDPLRFGGGLTSLYSYVGSDPLNGTDPTGLDVTLTCRPLSLLHGLSKPVHCGVFVWHRLGGGCMVAIDRQFSLGGGDTTFNGSPGTSRDDRDSFFGKGVNYDIPVPVPFTPEGFDQNVIDHGLGYSQGPYRLWGPNSNTAAFGVITAAGGTVPTVAGAVGQSHGR
jgi:RHS repeat-associated protein